VTSTQRLPPRAVSHCEPAARVRRAQRAKRFVDVVVGTLLAVAAIPIIAASATAAAVSLRTARPFFVQLRVGRDGDLFRFVKVRTLPLSVATTADKYAIADVKLPWVCRFLRSSHLDELPQLFLVIRGHMSLVGPRPEMPHLLASFDERFVSARSLVRPGCTGLWQISEAAGGLIGEAPEYDLHYLEHGGLKLDLWILARTVRAFLPGASGVSLTSMPHAARSDGLVDQRCLQRLLAAPSPVHLEGSA